MDSTFFLVAAWASLGFVITLLVLALFEPPLKYKIAQKVDFAEDSEEFLRLLATLTDAQMHSHTQMEVLTNGELFYEEELKAIRSAKRSINLEAYIFQRGKLTRRFVEALADRARAGVAVNLTLDAVGCLFTRRSLFRPLLEAGGRVEWYHSLRWHLLPRWNNRTHRELIIIDGQTGFIGGAGFADHWIYGKHDHPRWRDTMVRVHGSAVSSLQSVFAENWLEVSGEILTGDEYFPFPKVEHNSPSLVIGSAPWIGRSTRARVLFQMLLAAAGESIDITTPYFLPDSSAREELIRATKQRGVRVRILTPGQKSDHFLTRTSSRRLYGELLEEGAEIYEYVPAMIHAKVLIIDGRWSIVGSTNFDHRSFGLNDEVNLASLDVDFAKRLTEDFEKDLTESRRVTLSQWKRRSLTERAGEALGWILERQQ